MRARKKAGRIHFALTSSPSHFADLRSRNTDTGDASVKVSVVITCYNYGKYIEKCLDSVLPQTFKDYEVIVVNDGSTDDSEDKILKYTGIGNVRYILQKNSGQARAKNVGIRNSRCDYIAFLDADDLWEPCKLERQIPYFDDPDVGVVYSRARFVDEEGKDVVLDLSSPCFETHSGHVTRQLFVDNFVPFSSSVVRKRCLDEFGSFDESLAMGIDWDRWLRISTKYKFVGLKEPYLIYRVGHTGQMSKNLELRHKCTDKIMLDFLDRFPDFVDKKTTNNAFFHTYLSRGYYYRFSNLKKSYYFLYLALKIRPFSLKVHGAFLKSILKIA